METGVTAISLARSYACAIQNEALKCWGNNKFGQLGNGTKKESLTPQIVKGMKSGVTAISLARNYAFYACGIKKGAFEVLG